MNKSLMFFCAFAILSCTRARPDLSLGYRYNQGYSSEGAFKSTSYNPTASSYSYFASQPSVGQIDSSGFLASPQSNKKANFYGFGQQSLCDVGGSAFNGGSSHDGSVSCLQTPEGEQQNVIVPIVRKHFYIHTAPSDDDEEEIIRHIQVGQPQTNYRIVFINTPSPHATKAKIIAHIAPTKEKTAIYVLAKKNSELDISAQVNTNAPVNNKPEVFFIKYKTQEEAARAQHAIQAQYDALGGTNDISNEDQVSISSLIGTLPTSDTDSDISTSETSTDGTLTSNIQQTYLPVNPKLKFK